MHRYPLSWLLVDEGFLSTPSGEGRPLDRVGASEVSGKDIRRANGACTSDTPEFVTLPIALHREMSEHACSY